ncbi:MAG: SDR family oxidoreductase [Bacteroidia bacterium]
MNSILITGATGNVGAAVIAALLGADERIEILAGLRGLRAGHAYGDRVKAVPFDFADPASATAALRRCDTLFLLRPPQLADVKTYFQPLIAAAREQSVKHIVFLSVQGADKSPLIPHHKIERLIVQSGIPYTFLRPAYFMQNFTTTLLRDITAHDRIYLPASDAKFALIDVQDVGIAAAQVLCAPTAHLNQAYDLTNGELLNFGEMAAVLSEVAGRVITYTSPGLLPFFLTKRREGIAPGLILVMIMLHYLPRFQAAPALSDWAGRLTGRQPATFAAFARRHEALFRPDAR